MLESWVRSVVHMRWERAALAVLMVATAGACGGDGSQERHASAIDVDVVHSTGAEGVSAVVSTGATLVAETWGWSRSSLYVSENGGASWSPSEVPEPAGMDISVAWRLKVFGDRVLAFGGRNVDPTGPRRPFIWWSSDGGRSFVAGAGVAAANDVGRVYELDQLGDRLIALGTVGDRTVSWTSTDRGATWSSSLVDGLRFDDQYSTAVVAGSASLLSSDGGHLVRSSDGRSWRRADLPTDLGGVGQVERIGDLILLQSDPPYASRDGGRTWTALGNLDSKGSTTSGHGPVAIRAAAGQHLIGSYNQVYGDGETVDDRLVWSDDGGATWRPSRVPVHCSPGEDGPEVSISDAVAVGDTYLVIWGCAAGNKLLASTDDGRSWRPLATHPHEDLFNLISRGRGAIVIGSSRIEQQVDDVIRLSSGS